MAQRRLTPDSGLEVVSWLHSADTGRSSAAVNAVLAPVRVSVPMDRCGCRRTSRRSGAINVYDVHGAEGTDRKLEGTDLPSALLALGVPCQSNTAPVLYPGRGPRGHSWPQ